MTELEKPVRRRTRFPFAHYCKRIVVILEPGDCVAMRLERTRKLFRAPIGSEWHVAALRREKQLARKRRRAA
jgi:hypothetical protein